MKKIDILTFWGVPNYGAFCQAYALAKVVKELKPECEVGQIAYLHRMHWEHYNKKKKPVCFGKKDLLTLRYFSRLLDYKRNKYLDLSHFENDWNIIPHTDISDVETLEATQWDTVITGSDTVWEYSVKAFGDDEHLVGQNLKYNKLISYAASFGDMNVGDEYPYFVKEGLNKYDALAVRDQVSADIVKHFTGKNARITLDPTLLYDFKNDPVIPKPAFSNYILVYGKQFSDELASQVKEYAKDNNLTIIGVGIAPEWCDKIFTTMPPLEWIGLFSKAEFVVTCTFHGLMFSLIHERKIVFNQVEYVKNRSSWLLNQLNLDELYSGKVTLDKCLNYNWDYSVINGKLDELRKPSIEYLREALSE